MILDIECGIGSVCRGRGSSGWLAWGTWHFDLFVCVFGGERQKLVNLRTCSFDSTGRSTRRENGIAWWGIFERDFGTGGSHGGCGVVGQWRRIRRWIFSKARVIIWIYFGRVGGNSPIWEEVTWDLFHLLIAICGSALLPESCVWANSLCYFSNLVFDFFLEIHV